MKNRNRRVPPPPPPPTATRPSQPMPDPRPRRIDIPSLSSRTGQQRRAVPMPAPPTDWPLPRVDPADRRPAPAPLPKSSDKLGEVLRDLNDRYIRPIPRRPRPAIKSARPSEPKDSAKRLNIPVICTQSDRPFVLVFRESFSIFGTRFKLEATLTDIGEVGEAIPSVTVPIGSMNWSGCKCPHCFDHSLVRPIRCGQCGRLACDGRVKAIGDDYFFQCAPSCGGRGWLRGALETVTGSEGRAAPSPPAANGFLCGPAAPRGNFLKLPKPR